MSRKRFVKVISAMLIAGLTAIFFVTVITRFPVRYVQIVQSNAGRLEPSLVYAVIQAESSFKTEARSHKGAAGLMQITEGTAEWMAANMRMPEYTAAQLYDPEINIAIGCYFLNWLMDYYDGEKELVLCAYNAGLGNVNRWLADDRYSANGKTLNVIPFPETRDYVKRVARNQFIYNFLLIFN